MLQAQESAQEAALRYQRAVGMYLAAKETISIAEDAAITTSGPADQRRQFDSALQEMLNLSTEKVDYSHETTLYMAESRIGKGGGGGVEGHKPGPAWSETNGERQRSFLNVQSINNAKITS